ncbi:MAG: translation initiation factor IF-2 [Euryarchaeota archaeon CG_4_9_14_3_um_filter_38_12]|nr:MAG: translation initiation factor IF-2 [Euryarchaeota archaeon CG_4_9_14_3_um_filter_38_12]
MIRQPIVSVLGHIDHGKTQLLDTIRGTTVIEREAGRITQHIGATEVPIDVIYMICGSLLGRKRFTFPGLLFIDTPGHQAFTTLRARGGALSDLAVLVVDINEGFKPQTVESLNILKRYKTPFVVAANKIDLISGWVSEKKPFAESYRKQVERARDAVDEKIYEIVGKIYNYGFSSERYDRITDFTKNVAIVPISAKTGEGIQDLLMVLVGLAQRFLEKQLKTEEGPGEGTVLEVKEEKGLGPTVDVIIYNGSVKQGDTVVLGGIDRPIVTKVKALLKPKPLDEIRDPTERFKSVKNVSAASGVKISGKHLEDVIAGAPLKVAVNNADEIIRNIQSECKIVIETEEDGVVVKADAIGSLEGLAFELKNKGIPIKKAEVGDVSRRDVTEASTVSDPLRRAVLGFNIKVLPDVKEEQAKLFVNNVIYKLLDDYEEWCIKRKVELEKEKREEIVYPGKIKILEGCIFRISRPAIVGVRVLGGRIKIGQELMMNDGKIVGKIKSIRSVEESYKEAISGKEVAIAMNEPTVGRQIKENDVLYVSIPESDVKKLSALELTFDEKEIINEVIEIKRKEKAFWGM